MPSSSPTPPDMPRAPSIVTFSIVLTTLIIVGGWVWYLSAEAAQVTAIEHRVTAIETREVAAQERLADMADRLARMEPMLQYLVHDAQAAPKPFAR